MPNKRKLKLEMPRFLNARKIVKENDRPIIPNNRVNPRISGTKGGKKIGIKFK